MKIFIVGGFLRDQLLGKTPKDKDYVVVGASPEEMQAQGYLPIGQDFPVFLHPKTHEEYALARTERKTGQGYRGFTFYTSAQVTLEQDLLRRDFTINAMAQEIDADGQVVGPLIDPYGGQKDIKARIFRHVSDAFQEDPLRILRLARLMARLDEFEIDGKTSALVQHMVQQGELKFLVPERVWAELSRGLLEKKPSRMIAVLMQTQAYRDILPTGIEQPLVLDFTQRALDTGVRQNPDIHVQLAYLLAQIESGVMTQWARQWKVPTDLKNFTQVFHHIYNLNQGKSLSAEVILQCFNLADAWRKPERFDLVISAMETLGLPMEHWRRHLSAVRAVDAGKIAQSLHPSPGEHIHAAISAARLQAIAACL